MDGFGSCQSITTMSRYNPEWTFPVAFPPASMANVLAEWIAKQGYKQCHIAGRSTARSEVQKLIHPL